MKILGIIPARYGSTRFPGKPLTMINGKTMINRVFDQASKSKFLDKVIIATDDNRIYNSALSFTKNIEMTSKAHKSGTDRCAEIALQYTDFQIIVNIQGDEPFIDPLQIDMVIENLISGKNINIATLAKKIENEKDIFDANTVKVVFDKNKTALYFSRSPIPFLRNKNNELFKATGYFKHIGLYGFRRRTLLEISKLPASPLEIAESLEQLRWLENGYKISVSITEIESFNVDVPDDLKKFTP